MRLLTSFYNILLKPRALHHVTYVGGARFDRSTGDLVGGGLRPDVVCECRQGIPRNVGADFCVGMALDALEDANFFRLSTDVEMKQALSLEGDARDGILQR